MFKIENGRLSFWQWDTNQRLIVEDASITEVHFCNRTGDCSLVCEVYEESGKRLVNVPNILLQDNWTIRVYAYCANYTKIEEKFIVFTRSKPADYVYTETEIKNYEDLVERINQIEENGISDEKINGAIERYLDENGIEVDLTGYATEEYVDAAIGGIVIPAPDFTGYATEEYVDNAIENIEIPEVDLTDYATKQYVNETVANAQLGGGEVDLTDYATKDYVDNAIAGIDIPEVDLSGIEMNGFTSSDYLTSGGRQAIPAMISFMDDDCRKEVYENIVDGEDHGLFALIKATGIPYTLACPPGSIHVSEGDGNEKYMELDDLKEMYDYGVTLSCHHWRQYNMDDTQLLPTPESYDADLQKCQDKFAEWGIKGVDTVSYPQGHYKKDYIPVAKSHYKMGFSVDRGINKIPYESFYMKRNEVFPTNGAYTLDDAKALVREVAASGGWLIFMTHAWYDTFNYEALAEDLIPYIREQGVEIVDVNTALAKTGNVIEVGDFKKPMEEILDSYYVVDANGDTWTNSLNLAKKQSTKITDISADYHRGYYLVTNGGFREHSDTNRIISDKFDVKEGEVYNLTCSAIYTNCLFVVYNAEGGVVDYLQPKTNTDAAIDGDTVLTDYEYTIKPGGVSMRVASNLNIQPDKYKIKKVERLADASISNLEGYATKEYVDNAVNNMDIPDVPSKVSAFTNDAGYQTEAQVIALINANMPASGDEVSY